MMRSFVLAIFALLLAGAVHMDAAENAEIAARRAAERKTFTDAEIAEGFFKTVIGAELRLRGRTDVVRKYVVPVRVHVDSRAKPDRRGDVAKVVADIRAHVENLDIAVTDDRASANVFVTLVREHRKEGRA